MKEEEKEGQISKPSTTKEEEETTLYFLDSLDNYLILIQQLSSTLRQGWLELASARHSMGASRVNTALLSLKHHSAATTLGLDYDDNAVSTMKSPRFRLCKWASTDDKNSSLEKENIEEDEQLKENLSRQDSENQESSLESSKGSETITSPHKTENHFEKERAKVLSMFGTLVSPKLRASQISFETDEVLKLKDKDLNLFLFTCSSFFRKHKLLLFHAALDTLVEIVNVRSSILEAHDALIKDSKNTEE